MTISYNWLSEYLPEAIEPDKLSRILTAIGLEVESLEKYEQIKGGLIGLIVGKIVSVEQHPNADKLILAQVDIGKANLLQIVCGAPNAAAGQKVIIAPEGTTIYPVGGDPVTMRAANIRGIESQGMICAEDEIGIGTDHSGIIVLPGDVAVGTEASAYFEPYTDWIYEIGLTPNRMDAMSHYGVAKDVCAYLSHHNKQDSRPKSPFKNTFKADNISSSIQVVIENTEACQRYSGISISGITVKQSPGWIRSKLTAIGLRPINNIVDITNYILHETGQPLHAFDADEITGSKVIVKNLPEETRFITLDDKERKLSNEDLVICNTENGMCIAGVFGGIKSGVKESTKNIFLESAWFNPVTIRKTSLRHGLRTDAAVRFEKGVDISNTVNVLKRAALLIKEIAGGEISSNIIDVYPNPKEKQQVGIRYHYLKKLSGKNYHPDAVKRILTGLGFEIIKEGMDELWVAVPYSKPDISLPADIVEEILRIDGLDNVELTGSITITPAVDENALKENLREKLAGFLTGIGFNEIVTNSITNSKYYSPETLATSVKMINNLSADLDVLRPSMVETGLECINYNINRKNNLLRLYEFGKTYQTSGTGNYDEVEHLALYLTGNNEGSWKTKANPNDLYQAKGMANALLELCGINGVTFQPAKSAHFAVELEVVIKNRTVGILVEIDTRQLQNFDIRQPVYMIDFNWTELLLLCDQKITYTEVSKFPSVQRDLSIVLNNNIHYESVQKQIDQLKLSKLRQVKLFDVFESEKLGADKKSLAINLTFLDDEKTLTDKETDGMMSKVIEILEKQLNAQVRI